MISWYGFVVRSSTVESFEGWSGHVTSGRPARQRRARFKAQAQKVKNMYVLAIYINQFASRGGRKLGGRNDILRRMMRAVMRRMLMMLMMMMMMMMMIMIMIMMMMMIRLGIKLVW